MSTRGETDEESDAEDEGGKRDDEAVFGAGGEVTFEGALAAVGSVGAKRHVEDWCLSVSRIADAGSYERWLYSEGPALMNCNHHLSLLTRLIKIGAKRSIINDGFIKIDQKSTYRASERSSCPIDAAQRSIRATGS